jgi:hypothetical protein
MVASFSREGNIIHYWSSRGRWVGWKNFGVPSLTDPTFTPLVLRSFVSPDRCQRGTRGVKSSTLISQYCSQILIRCRDRLDIEIFNEHL